MSFVVLVHNVDGDVTCILPLYLHPHQPVRKLFLPEVSHIPLVVLLIHTLLLLCIWLMLYQSIHIWILFYVF